MTLVPLRVRQPGTRRCNLGAENRLGDILADLASVHIHAHDELDVSSAIATDPIVDEACGKNWCCGRTPHLALSELAQLPTPITATLIGFI